MSPVRRATILKPATVGDGDDALADGGDVALIAGDFQANFHCYYTYRFRQLPFHHL